MEARVGSGYEAIRDQARAEAVAAAAVRRIDLGSFTLVFFDRTMVQSALEEELRAEAVTAPERVSEAEAAFSAASGGSGKLHAILFLDSSDPAELTELLNRWRGAEKTVVLHIGQETVSANAWGDLAPATPLTFELSSQQIESWSRSRIGVAVEDSRCRAEANLNDEQRQALAGDLG